MKLIIMFLVILPFSSAANQAYRCTDEHGRLSFQALPCDGGVGSEERVTLPSAPAVGWEQPVESREEAATAHC